MKKIALFILIFSLLLTAPIYSLEAGWHYDYRGTIIDETGGLALVCNGDNIIGELYLDSDFIDIPLSGKIKDNDITLKSKKGIIIEATLRNGVKGKITMNGKEGNIDLRNVHSSSGGLDSRYEVGGMNNDKLVEATAKKFKEAILSKNIEDAASMIRYPLNTDIGKIKDKKEFISKFDDIFYPQFLKAFKKAIPHNMFSRDLGAMMVSDDNVFWVWFSGNKKPSVISIYSDENKLQKDK